MEEALESMSGTSENQVVFYALEQMNALKNYPKAKMFGEKMRSLYNKDKEAGNQAFAEVKPLLEFYAKKQVPPAQTFLGYMYYNGEGVKEDKAEAMKWYRKAAEQGFALAQDNLGDMYWYMYYFGNGVNEDKAEAVKWYRKAAEQGYAGAQSSLGMKYSHGEGVEEDKAEAVKWFRKAAEQGHAKAQFGLGIAYYYGSGVKQDYKTAYMWYCLARLSGYSDANDNLRELEKGGWFESAKVSYSEANEAEYQARLKYHEIRKRYGLD